MTPEKLQKHKQHCDMHNCEICALPSGDEQLIEKLAAIEHERWADWQNWVHQCADPYTTGADKIGLLLRQDTVDRWERQINTPYSELSEVEKQSDRDQVMRYWPLVQEYVNAIIAAQNKEARDKWKSVCGCPMCGHHTSAYAPQTTVMEKEDI